jgi:hypothetical protein
VKLIFSLFLFISSPMVLFANDVTTVYVPKYICSPKTNLLRGLSEGYINRNAKIPDQSLAQQKSKMDILYRVMNGSAKDQLGTLKELKANPLVNPWDWIEHVVRFGEVVNSAGKTFRIFRKFPESCEISGEETCLWDNMLNVIQDITISQDHSMAALISNATFFTADVVLFDLSSGSYRVFFSNDGARKSWSSERAGQVHLINDDSAKPRFLAYRNFNHTDVADAVTFVDLSTNETVSINRIEIESQIGVKPDPTFFNTIDIRTFYSVDIERVFKDLKGGKIASVPNDRIFYDRHGRAISFCQ